MLPKLNSSGIRWGFILPCAVAVLIAAASAPPADPPHVTVYMRHAAEDCSSWAQHLQSNGFEVTVVETEHLVARKVELGVPHDLYSCHTAVVDGYVVEGDVPADLIHTFLEEHCNAVGLAVPVMPEGAPGVKGTEKDQYEVIVWFPDGERETVARRPTAKLP